jgi:cold shock CspA family protein
MNDENSKAHFTPFPSTSQETKGSEVSIDNKTYEGTVIWFGGKKGEDGRSKSYGFIEWFDNGVQQRDIFVHFSNIVVKDGGYRTLQKGQKVKFAIGKNFHDENKAIFVEVIEQAK